MAQNITLLGANYSAVPAVQLPKTGGGTARFDDCTVVTAEASDVASGKVFVASDGTVTTGTGSGGDEFIVNLSYDSQNDIWTPDCTYAEIDAAYISGKNIATSAYTSDGYAVVSSCWIDDEEDIFSYNVFPYDGILSWDDPTKMLMYDMDSNDDITLNSYVDLYPSPAGTLSITSNGIHDVLSYAAVNVNVPSSAPNLQAKTNIAPTTSSQTITADSGYDGLSSVQINAMPTGTAGTPTATKGTVSNHSVSVTPSVTNTTGYITGGTKTGTAVTVSASELVSGSQTITQNGTVDVTNLASVAVNVSGGGGSSMNCQVAQSTNRATSSTYTELITLTCTTAGTYDVYWSTFRSSTSGTWGSQLYLNDVAYGSAQTGSWSNNVQNIHLTGVHISANAEVAVRVRSRGNNYYGYVGTLTIKQTA